MQEVVTGAEVPFTNNGLAHTHPEGGVVTVFSRQIGLHPRTAFTARRNAGSRSVVGQLLAT